MINFLATVTIPAVDENVVETSRSLTELGIVGAVSAIAMWLVVILVPKVMGMLNKKTTTPSE